MTDKIFGYTREELVDMFEPLSEFEEKVGDMMMDMQKDSNKKTLMLASTADYKKNVVLWLQQKIEGSKMSKRDKEQVIDWIGSVIGLAFNSGKAYQVKESGMMDDYIKEEADIRVGYFKAKEAGILR